MRVNRHLALFPLLAALTLWAPDKFAHAGQKNGPSAKRGEKASTQMSAKGKENTNAQWSADPDQGWVRADERHELQERRKAEASSKHKSGKQIGKADKTEKPTKKGHY
jgi:hypothetical protein